MNFPLSAFGTLYFIIFDLVPLYHTLSLALKPISSLLDTPLYNLRSILALCISFWLLRAQNKSITLLSSADSSIRWLCKQAVQRIHAFRHVLLQFLLGLEEPDIIED